jgi:hypothetical protein
VLDNSAFPASGEIVVGDEIISYSGKSPNTNFGDNTFWMKHSENVMKTETGYTYGERLLFNGYGHWSLNEGDPAYLGMAVVPFRGTDVPVYGDTYKIEAYDVVPPSIWGPNVATAGWSVHVGDTSFGNWVAFNPTGDVHAIYVMPTGINRYVNEMTNFSPPEARMRVLPALHLSQRGLHGSAVTSHGASDVIYYVDIELYADRIEYFGKEEDISLSDALKRTIRLAGGQVSTKAKVDQVVSVSTADTWKLLPFSGDKSDFIAEMTLPVDLADTNTMVGMVFRASTPVDQSFSDSYFLAFSDSVLRLYQMPGMTLLSSVSVEFTPVPSGVLKVSVQGKRIAVWVDHRLVHVFYDATIESGNYAAFAVYNPANSAQFDFRGRVSELDDLMADLTIGVRGKGMAVVGEMTNNRRVLFRCDPDGSLNFFKTPTSVGVLPDLVLSYGSRQLDNKVSRVRVEGTQIVELADFSALSEIGNVFETINSPYAGSIADLKSDGAYHIQSTSQRADEIAIDAVFHPALQPGDAGQIVIDGQTVDACVISSSVTFGFEGETFDINATLEVYKL